MYLNNYQLVTMNFQILYTHSDFIYLLMKWRAVSANVTYVHVEFYTEAHVDVYRINVDNNVNSYKTTYIFL